MNDMVETCDEVWDNFAKDKILPEVAKTWKPRKMKKVLSQEEEKKINLKS